jgi:phospholipid/cholesterol/gamma-HCH transport system substrate-binding protein
MQKQAPTLGRVMVMAIFTLSCFGLLLYLWAAFGGPVPLKPRGYRFTASFLEATQLAQEADVRISGVKVGRVKKIELGDDGRSETTIELEDKYAPPPSDSRAILRQKTLLGETYVELTPGTNGAPKLDEGAKLAVSNVAPTVELDEIFRSFDPKTRKAFQTWQQSVAQGINGRGQNFSDALGQLQPFAEDTNKVLEILQSQQRAVQQFVRNTGVVFDALTEREGQLASLIDNSNRVFSTTADRDQQIKETFIALPTFIDESKKTLRRLESYAANTDPLVSDLHPWAREASKTLGSLEDIAPDFERFFTNLGPVNEAAKTGLPAGRQFLDDLRPVLGQLDPFLRDFNPFLRYLSLFRKELVTMFASNTGALGYNDKPGTDVRALRLSVPVNPETLATYPRRLGPNRSNAYALPRTFDKLRQGLDSFTTEHCGRGGYPDLAPAGPNLSADLRSRIMQFFFGGSTAGNPPPCRKQGKFTFGGETTDYPHAREDPRPAP